MLRPKDWAPDDTQKKRLLDFEGYGPDTADVIFVGLEEYCSGDADEQRDSIWIRCTNHEFEAERADKNRALAALSGLVKTNVPVWDVMAGIVSGLTKRPCYLERHDLGTRPAAAGAPLSTWLTNLRPLPRPGSSKYADTYIPEWFGDRFEAQRHYNAASKTVARGRLLAALSSSKPKYAFFFGDKATWVHWSRKNFFGELLCSPFSMPFPGIEVAETAFGTKLVLTHFYNSRHRTSTFGLEHVGDLLRSLGA